MSVDLNQTDMMAVGPRGGDVNTGGVSHHPGLVNDNADWLRIVGPPPGHGVKDGLVCSLWVVDHVGNSRVEKWVDVFDVCVQGICACAYHVEGAVAQLKPCRIYAEAMCCGDSDSDWEYVL